MKPSNQRNWSEGQERLPRVTFRGDSVFVQDVRNFEWRETGAPVERWETRAYDLNELETVWFALAPFDRENRGPAHAFLSFGFRDSQYVAVSVEARREAEEEYSLLKGVLRQFEIIYIIADERDVVRLRTNVRDDDVYMYPIRTTPAKARAVFVEMLKAANRLHERPEFYNTLTNNCTTVLLDHVNRISPGRVPYRKEVLFPGYADELAQRLGLIDPNASIDAVRAKYLVNARAREFSQDSLFSVRIRES